MKILMIFCDMFGADYLNMINDKYEPTGFDELLKQIGGTLYTNCFTPAPDTPRSSACAWTGLYPKANGCDNRLKYPGNFLNTDYTIFNVLNDNNYKINAYVKQSMNRIGLLPKPFQEYVKYSSFKESLKKFDVCENSFSFFYFPDLHLIMDVNGYNKKRFYEGANVLASNIRKIFNCFDYKQFDYIIIYSDHGFRICNHKHLIEDDRIKTLMFIHKKGDCEIKFDNFLHSNIDLFPTICNMIKVEICKDLDGISLLSQRGHEYVLVEDHQDFSVKLGQTIEHWAVVDKFGKHWLECDGIWEHENSNTEFFDEQLYLDLIINKMNDFEKNHNLYTILHKYDNYKSDNKYLSDGTKIKISILNNKFFKFLKKVFCYIVNIFKKGVKIGG